MVVLALGFGAFLLDTVYVVQHNLLRDLRVDASRDRPNLALFDIQPDQRDGAARAARARGPGHRRSRVPIVPMRIVSVKGASAAALLARPPCAPGRGRRRGRAGAASPWTLRREYRSTYRDTTTSSERVVAGTAWAAGAGLAGAARRASRCPSRSRRAWPRELGVGVGDEIVWDVQGVTVPTRVASLREVDWARFEPNFFVVFPSGPLDAAPQTLPHPDPRRRRRPRARGFSARVVEAFPNVTALDLAQVQEAIEKMIAPRDPGHPLHGRCSAWPRAWSSSWARWRPAATSACARACC